MYIQVQRCLWCVVGTYTEAIPSIVCSSSSSLPFCFPFPLPLPPPLSYSAVYDLPDYPSCTARGHDCYWWVSIEDICSEGTLSSTSDSSWHRREAMLSGWEPIQHDFPQDSGHPYPHWVTGCLVWMRLKDAGLGYLVVIPILYSKTSEQRAHWGWVICLVERLSSSWRFSFKPTGKYKDKNNT